MKKKDKVNIDLPENSLKKNVDIIIKRNFKSDFKFIDIEKFEIFYKIDTRENLFFERIKKFKLKNIKFFPKTFLKNGFVFQKNSQKVISIDLISYQK